MSGARLEILLVVAVSVPAAALAQTPVAVRVVHDPAPIQRWFRAPATHLLVEVAPGTTLDVLDEENGWFWVLAPRDGHGTQEAGWIRASHVEPVIPRAASLTPKPSERDGARPGTVSMPQTATMNEDKVTITTRRDAAGSPRASAPVATKAYTFDDVLFDRDRHALGQEDMVVLHAAVTALKADPSLVVNIEGHTCNLGTPAYNLALGARRADAVKRYLVSEGIAVDRLHSLSLGEDRAEHDNAREETRRLNRRVALVPSVQR